MRPERVIVRLERSMLDWLASQADQWHGGNMSAVIRRVLELGKPEYERRLKERAKEIMAG